MSNHTINHAMRPITRLWTAGLSHWLLMVAAATARLQAVVRVIVTPPATRSQP